MLSSERTARLLAIWRTAYTSKARPYVLKTPSPSIALPLRVALFKVLAPYRADRLLDPTLTLISETITIKALPPGSSDLLFIDKVLDEFLSSLDLDLSLDLADPEDLEKVADAIKRKADSNPYY